MSTRETGIREANIRGKHANEAGNRNAGIREFLNKHPGWTVVGLVGVILLAAGYGYTGVRQQDRPDEPKGFYTDDDGKTWFADSAYRVVPYERDGKQVVRAKVFNDGKHDFVCYLERYKDGARKKLEEQVKIARDKKQSDQTAFTAAGLSVASMEVKKPGVNGPWTPITDTNQAARVYSGIVRSAGDPSTLKAVLP